MLCEQAAPKLKTIIYFYCPFSAAHRQKNKRFYFFFPPALFDLHLIAEGGKVLRENLTF